MKLVILVLNHFRTDSYFIPPNDPAILNQQFPAFQFPSRFSTKYASTTCPN